MSTTMTTPVDLPPAHTARPVTFAGAARSEWIKFRSLRSSWFTLGAAVVAFVAISLAIAYNTGRNFGGLAPEDSAVSATSQGYLLAELMIGVLGVLFVSGEYTTGMIRSTLAAVPKRLPVLLAKAGTFSVVVSITMLVTSVGAFLGAQAILGHYHHGHSLTDPSAVRVVVGVAAYLTLIGLLGSALGWILRSTPGGISALLGLLLVAPVLLGQLLGSWGRTVAQFLPSEAGGSFLSSVPAENTLTPWAGLAVLAVWVAVALSVAAIRLRNRDG